MKRLIVSLALLAFAISGTFAQTRISCVGASITEGSGTTDFKTKSYPGQLQTMLGTDYVVNNFGRGGCTMLRRGDCPYWAMEKFEHALNSNPDIVLIDLGGNDAKWRNRILKFEFVRDACEMVRKFQSLPSKPRVILMTAIVGFTKDSLEIWDEAIVRDINPLIVETAKEMNVEVIDMHPILLGQHDLMPDAIHPNDKGAEMIAKKLADYLKKYPRKPSDFATVDGLPTNPFVTHLYAADPSAHVWKDGRLYLYPSHDVDPPRGCDLMDKYHVFSTDDMVNWKDHGEILNSDQVEWGRPEGGFMWAPDCAYKNGKYYFYFPHPSGTDWNNTWKVGVAVSKYPDRDFKVLGYMKNLGDAFAMIDPCVFIDDDGKAYFYYGGGGRCVGAKLKTNMIDLAEPLRPMEGLVDFHEATWVFKRNGIYYLTYADNHVENGRGANRLCYAMSNSPYGPWEYKGVYLEPTGCDTSHGSVVEYKGEWYAFYHNQSISNMGNLRSLCMDRLEFNADGTIKMVNQRK